MLFSEYLVNYFPVVIFILVAMAFAIATLMLSYVVQPRVASAEKSSPL